MTTQRNDPDRSSVLTSPTVGEELGKGPDHQDVILVVDDDANLSQLLTLRLEKAGFKAVSAANGHDGLREFFNHRPDLVVLDIMLPDLDGWEVCRRLRDMSDVPIVMLTAKVGERDELYGLSLGADDYVTKPFSAEKLLARIRAALWRSRTPVQQDPQTIYSDGMLTIDFWRHEVHVRGKKVELSPMEYRLLTTLVRRAGQVTSREELLRQVWGSGYADISLVKLYVGYLRSKVETNPANPEVILNLRGVGYYYQQPS